ESHAVDVAAWLDAQRLAGTRFVGFSWGGLIGLHLAEVRPDLIERLAMIDITPSFATGEREVPDLPYAFDTLAEAVEAERRVNRFAGAELLEVVVRESTRTDADGALVKKYDPVFTERWPFREDDRWDQLG